MKPFRTNRKDRQLFAQALGLREYGLNPFGLTTFKSLDRKNGACVLAENKGRWYYTNNGFEWCLQEFCRRNPKLETSQQFQKHFGLFSFWIYKGVLTIGYAECQSIGEAFFRAVVEFERGKK